MKQISNIVKPELVVVFMLIIIVVAQKKIEAFVFICYCVVSLAFLTALKSLIGGPRPYMVNHNIVPLENYAEYGNPSGHVFMGYIWVTYIFENLVYNAPLYVNPKEPDNPIKKAKKAEGKSRWLKHVLRFFCIFLIGVSRIYLGMHSLD